MKKPRWFQDGFVDRAIQNAPRAYWLTWLGYSVFTVATLIQSYLSTGHSMLTGLLALGVILGFGALLAWTSIY